MLSSESKSISFRKLLSTKEGRASQQCKSGVLGSSKMWNQSSTLSVVGHFFRELPLLIGNERARSDEAHLTTENVEQLGQLIDPRAPQKPAYAGATPVGDLLRPTVVIRVCPVHHRTELVESENL